MARARQDWFQADGGGCEPRTSSRAPRLSVGYRGKLWPIEDVFYKWFRCEVVHAGGLPVDIAFIDDVEPGTLSVRAGGAPNYLAAGLPRVA